MGSSTGTGCDDEEAETGRGDVEAAVDGGKRITLVEA
jgi:hypothetical protein